MWNTCRSSSRNRSRSRSRSRSLCWALVALLVWQVSGSVPPLEPISTVSTPESLAVSSMRRRHWRHDWKKPQQQHEQQQQQLALEAADDPTLPRATTPFRRLVTVRGGGLASDLNDYVGATKARSWTVLMLSIAFDTIAVTLMKQAQVEAALHKMILPYGLFFLSLAGFGLCLKSIDVSIAYAVWASVGTAIVSVAGVVFFGEKMGMAKIICLTMILLGVVGLDFIDGH